MVCFVYNGYLIVSDVGYSSPSGTDPSSIASILVFQPMFVLRKWMLACYDWQFPKSVDTLASDSIIGRGDEGENIERMWAKLNKTLSS